MPERPLVRPNPRRLGAVGVVTTAALLCGSCASSDTSATTTTISRSSVAVVARRDIAQTKSETGTVGYGTAMTIKLSGDSSAGTDTSASTTATTIAPTAGRSDSGSAVGATSSSTGVLTSLPAVGSTVTRNSGLAEINGLAAAVLFYGERPMWRTLGVGSADGPDVAQLETNLVALGYIGITVDNTFSSATAAAVKKWQGSLGLAQTGSVLRDDVVFLPTEVRIAGRSAQLGDAASGPILTVTRTSRVVTVDLAQTDAGIAAPGTKVSIIPVTGPAVVGAVLAAETQTSASGGGVGGGGTATTTSVHVTIVVPEGAALPDGSVTAEFTTTQVTGVLAVPVKALLALSEGGYGVEKVTGSTKKLVAVEPGQFAGGFVEVRSGVAEGDRVIVPS